MPLEGTVPTANGRVDKRNRPENANWRYKLLAVSVCPTRMVALSRPLLEYLQKITVMMCALASLV